MSSSIMRRWLPVFVLLLGLLLATHASAAEPYPTIVPSLPDIQLYGTVGMAPLQPLAEQLGITVSLDAAKGVVTAKRGEHTVVFYQKSTTAAQDGAIVPLPMPAYPTSSGLWYVPVQTLIEGLGGTYTFDPARASATITLPERAKALVVPCVTPKDQQQPYQDDQPALYAVNIDGSNLRRLTFDSGSECLPVFIPNSSKFFSSRNGALVQRSAENPTEYPMPKPNLQAHDVLLPCRPCSVSADGKLLLFTMQQRYSMYASMFTLRRGEAVTTTVSREASFPSMNAAGDTIACLRVPENLDKGDPFSVPLYLMATDGSNRRLIVDKAYCRFTPVFSPDGSLLAFQRKQDINEHRIRTMIVLYQVTGAQAGTVYDIPWDEMKGMEGDVAFSQDSQWMAIAGDGLRIMKPDRSQAKLLITYFTQNPLFTPDGQQLLFTAGTMIRSVNSDGSQNHLILQGAGVIDLALTPDGQQILFRATPFAPTEIAQREEW